MAVIKNNKTGNWEVRCYYKDYMGERKQKTKRGFAKKSDAVEWERNFKLQTNLNLDMTFGKFVELYLEDIKPRLKYNTWLTKKNIIEKKILPYFKDKAINEIKPPDIVKWQNKLIKYKNSYGDGYSQTYLKTIHNQMSAILNHAVNLYDLKNNPARRAGSMGKKNANEMQFWTKEEYLKFVQEVADKEISYYAFEIAYWCGLRCGEILALTAEDFDFEKKTLRVNKSYQRLQKKDYITPPKTEKSNRTIVMPDFLAMEIKNYIDMIYNCKPKDRIFPVTKGYLHHEMDRGIKLSGVKRIRFHDLRHSHVSLLINMGFSAVAIGERLGHESAEITYHYAHLFPTVQNDMASKLNEEMENVLDVKEEHR